jgi:hypothetical protein
MRLIEAVLGSRIRGEKEPDAIIDAKSGAKELFDFVLEDARGLASK